MGNVRRLRNVLDELEDRGIDTDYVVFDEKAVHVDVPDVIEEAKRNPEEELDALPAFGVGGWRPAHTEVHTEGESYHILQVFLGDIPNEEDQ